MRVGAAFVFILLAFAASAANAASVKPVYRVDQATAVISGHHLVITAKGAVRTGGWTHPKLVVRSKPASRPSQLEVSFVATPPSGKAVVIQATVPVKVKLKTRVPRYGVAEVRVVSETNTVTAEIIPAGRRQKTARKN
jgi:hypothetical protein